MQDCHLQLNGDLQMDIFIDTSVIYTDPFWKRNFPGQLLEDAKEGRINLYIADVVLRELRRNLEKQLAEEFAAINKANSNIEKLSRSHIDFTGTRKENFLKDFDQFYEQLFKNNNIYKLSTNESMFHEILERAIEYKKPFTDNRSEFKDAVIWTTYFKFAKEKGLQNCHLICNNTRDFSDHDGNLHPELKSDYDKFELHITIDEFYKKNKDTIQKVIIEFKNWINEQKIDEEMVYDLLGNEIMRISEEVEKKLEKADKRFLLENKGIEGGLGGYFRLDFIGLIDCSDIEINIIKDFAIISGKVNTEIGYDYYKYNSLRELEEEKFSLTDHLVIKVEVFFNFIFDKDQKVKNLEITNIVF